MQTSSPAQAIFIDGPDATAFAHGQFTSQVATLPVGQWQFSSWLDAQGRIRHLFHLARLSDERLLVFLRGGEATHFVDALRRFVFRSRVKLQIAEGMKLRTGDALPVHIVDTQDDIIRLGCGSHSLQLGVDIAHDDAWQLAQLHTGWPWLSNTTLNEFLPPSLSLHRLGAVALDKGCYPGQEIVARLHYRGGNKRHLHRVKLSREVSDGVELRRGDREFVRLLTVISHNNSIEALAVITDETANNIAQSAENTSDDGVSVTLLESWQD
ncbi:folate-binding protein YgfZ [Dyella caseinilytica]|uniref:Folate-binding protein YgfZ n=1 Tax=Dyella caseinilytica TaxID=1849581 RepID=A0ABX7GXJ4_9GAMM|nr:folate-binding protein YgfZ [Dyella caseinilytica]QRN55004.1 folate-binding protein YgfZ [Dyella caseinilytica]GFZ98610.1 folate-binding protein YgfZ [Dyella caseinilytica]